jgi:heavy metal efflux system protein
MIHGLVQFAVKQRFLVLMLVVFITVGGAISFQRMPVDAYPDLSPPMVEVITQWPGHAAEEVERLVTLPTEVEMNGVPKMLIQRSISLYGLSDVILTFDEDTNDYFARQIVFQRLSEVTYPTGVTPSLAPLSSANTSRCAVWPMIPDSAAPLCSIRCCSIPRGSTGITSRFRRCCSNYP